MSTQPLSAVRQRRLASVQQPLPASPRPRPTVARCAPAERPTPAPAPAVKEQATVWDAFPFLRGWGSPRPTPPAQAALAPPQAPGALTPAAPLPLMTQHVRAEHALVAQGTLAARSASFISESTRGPTQAVVLSLHGFSAGVWQMEEQRHRLNDAGFDMLGMRMPGHGALRDEQLVPDGLPHADEIARYDAFAQEAIANGRDWARRKNVPLIIFGFSLGGTTACRILSLDPHAADGLVVLAPLLGQTQLKFRLLHNVAWVLSLTPWGRQQLRGMPFSWGPLKPSPTWPGHWSCSSSQAYAAVEFARQVGGHGGQWRVPTLGIVSDFDMRCSSDAAERFLHARNPQAQVLRFGKEAQVPHAMLSPVENLVSPRVRQSIGDRLVAFVETVVTLKAKEP